MANRSKTKSVPPTNSFPCITCNQEVVGDSICCNGCQRWVHLKQGCSGLPTRLGSEIMKSNSDAIQYICTACRTTPQNQPNSINKLTQGIEQLFLTVQGLASKVAEIDNWRETQQAQRNSMASIDSNLIRATIKSELVELREQDKRRASLVVRGITYQSENDFKQKFNEVSNRLLGRTVIMSGLTLINSRIVRFNVDNREDRVQLLSSSPKLKTIRELNHVYISKDLTYKQRSELLSRRNNNKDRSSPPVTGANAVQDSGSVNAASPASTPLPAATTPTNSVHTPFSTTQYITSANLNFSPNPPNIGVPSGRQVRG